MPLYSKLEFELPMLHCITFIINFYNSLHTEELKKGSRTMIVLKRHLLFPSSRAFREFVISPLISYTFAALPQRISVDVPKLENLKTINIFHVK